ncbi:MAG TPA: FxsB family cyclophane-forming radical SAM/SPASM peptide maturase, partial [Rugosimonospora sp.]|nr:FxsB family cyclophane-forming radical SAM/SPASM peptide maturase [Rugosimonospora sp.]
MTTEGAPVRRWPISQYVIKVHSRCDLACDHCYVYEHADQSWRGRPRVMSPATVRAATGRIAEHAAAHHLPRVTVVLHGGEPLLLGPARMREVLATVRAGIDPVTRLDLRMQSNGLRLSEEFCALFAEYDVRVGISLDGDRTANDRHRRFADGRGSHDRVAQALRLLRRPEYRRQYAGILCTVDVANDPVAVYQALRSHEPPRVDLLLPHATWDSPPARPAPEAAPYAGWLLAVYDRWVAEGRPMAIRLFDALRSTARGGPSGSEWVGLDRADLVVIETDGAWEQVDSLKTAYDGAPATGLDVASHAVDEVSVLPQIVRRQTGLADLSGQCRGCPVVRQCGGGLFAHRYRSGTGFDNPSVYCADLKELIVGLNARMRAEAVPAAGAGADLPDGLLERIGSGRTDGDAVRFLAAGQYAINRALLVAVARAGTSEVRSAWDLLARLDREAPAAVAATLAHPYLRVWAAGTLRGVTADTGGSGYLANVALAAALRAGVPADLDVAARAGTVVLPGLGTVQVPAAVTGTVRLAATPEHLTVHHGGTSARVRLVPAHRLVTADYDLLLEDTDPHRDCYGEKVLDRMSAPSISRWAATVREAWQVIGADAPQHRDALAAGLRALVPLVADPAEQRSATAQD